eukprot:973441-Pelagomonas_calceolata.AAC.3
MRWAEGRRAFEQAGLKDIHKANVRWADMSGHRTGRIEGCSQGRHEVGYAKRAFEQAGLKGAYKVDIRWAYARRASEQAGLKGNYKADTRWANRKHEADTK